MAKLTDATIKRLLCNGLLTTSISVHEQRPSYCSACSFHIKGNNSRLYIDQGFVVCPVCNHISADAKRKLLYLCKAVLAVIRRVSSGPSD